MTTMVGFSKGKTMYSSNILILMSNYILHMTLFVMDHVIYYLYYFDDDKA